jgi:hypothetical protein
MIIVTEDFSNNSLSAGNGVPQEEHQGLRILAKMIAKAIIRDAQRARASAPSNYDKTE